MATAGEKMEVVTDSLFLGSRITVDGDCSHETRRRWLLGRKGMTDLDSMLKSRDVTLLTKVPIVKAVVCPGSGTVVRAGPERRQNTKELTPVHCGAGEDS